MLITATTEMFTDATLHPGATTHAPDATLHPGATTHAPQMQLATRLQPMMNASDAGFLQNATTVSPTTAEADIVAETLEDFFSTTTGHFVLVALAIVALTFFFSIPLARGLRQVFGQRYKYKSRTEQIANMPHTELTV